MYACQILGSTALLLQGSVRLRCNKTLANCRFGCQGVQARLGTSADAAIAHHAAQTGQEPRKGHKSIRLLAIMT